MKTKILLLLVLAMVGAYGSDVLAQTKGASVPKKTIQKEKPVQPQEDPKVVFNMKIQGNGSFLIDSINNYYVANFSGKTAYELYTDVLARISTIYSYPDKVTNKVEGRSIIINANVLKIDAAAVGVWTEFNLTYRIEILFKDGKIRINAPTLTRVWEYAPSIQKRTECDPKAFLVYEMFFPRLHDKTNAYFNNLYSELVYGSAKDEDW